jgi:hypothetical protein
LPDSRDNGSFISPRDAYLTIPSNVTTASRRQGKFVQELYTLAAGHISNMQTSEKTKTKGDLILEIHDKTTTTTVRDISESGVKLEQNSVSQAKGKLNAQGMSTVSFTLKTDGSNEWEMKGVMSTQQGDFLAVWGNGTGKQTGPTTAEWTGEVHFMSQSPKLSWINNMTGWVEGSGDQAKGEAWGKIYEKK